MNEQLTWTIIDKFFADNPAVLVSHHIDSYNDFFSEGIKQIFKEKNPIKIMKQKDVKTDEFNLRCNLFLGGKEGNKLYYGKPMIYDEKREHYMYPNEARLRNMTYGITIHYDVEVEFIFREEGSEEEERKIITLEKIFLGRFPIMLMSKLCILNGLERKVRFEMGECKNDYGGYFIIDGKEKAIIPQETFANNMLYVRDKPIDIYSHSAEIRSVSEDASKPIRTLAVKIVAPSTTLTNNQIVVNIPNVRKPVPLFILMRALGVESDRAIIEYCLLDMEKYANYIDLFIPSIHDAGRIFTQEGAINYIASFTKGHTIPHALEILSNYFLPHIGELNFNDKAYYIGYMVKQLLEVYMRDAKGTDRDNFRFKRVELPGYLMYELFKEYYKIQQREIYLKIDTTYFKNQGLYNTKESFISLIENNYKMIFAERSVEKGFRKALKGSWGAAEHTKRLGVVQDLSRLSYNAYISQLRKITLPLDASAKVVGPRLCHTSQWGIIDPVDTPDGGNAGLHKHLAISTHITTGSSAIPIMKWLLKHGEVKLLTESTPKYIAGLCKVIVNGNWFGVTETPQRLETLMKEYRRLALLPIFISIQWNIASNTLFIYTDSGRLCRPIYYLNAMGVPSYENRAILDRLATNNFTWEQLVTGFAKKTDPNFSIKNYQVYDSIDELYSTSHYTDVASSSALFDYIDSSETEAALIAMSYTKMEEEFSGKNKKGYTEEKEVDDRRENKDKNKKKKETRYTHVEIHPSLMLGIMGNQIVFPENNQLPRDLFACGQAKQAISLYHSNFPNRMDKMGVVLNNGQIPLVKSRYLKYINNEEHPCGENTIVAIMSWNGYNVEDSILFNEGALKRGMFKTTYYTTYESREESSKVGLTQVNSTFANIEKSSVIGLKPGYDYSYLDDAGIIKENTPMDDKRALIGKIMSNPEDPELNIDDSSFPKKGQEGFVDKTFITEGEEGFRIAKVRVRDQRIPAIGDKFCSRCGQKGTVGLIIPEEDMPFTADGIRPDIIINPHAIPSRMTIGQLVETIMGKACSMQGAFGDCTAFVNNGSKHKIFGEVLTKEGFHSSGSEVLYNGQTGEQLQADIFMGPTYYMRLKHMVKDKINYRALGPRTALTRQTVQGRANDGGMRIGEMERDGLISHGITKFLQESMLVRGDEYYMAVCNKTGMVAIYNESHNLFMSPMADGPIKFTGLLDDKMNIENITKFGRSFSILRIPYAFKLLIQELQAMNVQMRIITEDNIEQLTNMAFSQTEKVKEHLKLSDKMTALLSKSELPTLVSSKEKELEQKRKDEIKNKPYEKLVANKFHSFKLPQNSGTIPEFLTVNRANTINPIDEEYERMNVAVNKAKQFLDAISEKDYYDLSNNLDLYSNLKNNFKKNGFPFATNASLKMYELIEEMNLIDCKQPIRAFCDAELPGAFIVTINHFVKTVCKTKPDFDWIGSSFFPEDAAKKGDFTILGDKFEFYKHNRQNWLMGPRPNAMPVGMPDITGDLMNDKVIKTISEAVHTRFQSSGGATLATGDAGVDVSEDYGNQEKSTALLNYGQILAAILSLAPDGHMVTKQYTFISQFNRSLIALISYLFDEAYVVKPVTSRPGNSEVYIVGKYFRGISPELAQKLLERCKFYETQGLSPTDEFPLFDPADFKEIDTVLLEATKVIHYEQQIDFLNEIDLLYKNPSIPRDFRKISNNVNQEWLKKYPLYQIRPEDILYWKNKPNMKQPVQAQQVQAQPVQAAQQVVTNVINNALSAVGNLFSGGSNANEVVANEVVANEVVANEVVANEVVANNSQEVHPENEVENILTNIESVEGNAENIQDVKKIAYN